MSVTEYSIVIGYLALVLGAGILFSRKALANSAEQYFLGGRRIHWSIIGVSYVITLLSTISLVAVPGEAFNHGVGMSFRYLLAPVAALAFFYVFMWFFFQRGAFTPFAYLERRFDLRVRAVASVSFFSIRLVYVALVLYSSAKVFEGAAGWAVTPTILLVGTIGLAYVYLGGMRAVVWTDALQFLILVVGLFCVLVLVLGQVDGSLFQTMREGTEGDRGFTAEEGFFGVDPFVRVTFWFILWAIITDRMFYASGDQISVQRLLAVGSYHEAKKAMWFSQLLTVPTIGLLWVGGLAVWVFYREAGLPDGVGGDAALFHFVANEVPPVVSGLFLGAMVASIMSTLDSGLHSLTTVWMRDLYRGVLKRSPTDAQEMRLSRAVLVGLGIVAIGAALGLAMMSEGLEQTFLEASVFWMVLQGLIAFIFLAGVCSAKVTSGDILRAYALGLVITLAMCVYYWQVRTAEQPLSFLAVAVPGELAMLAAIVVPAIFRRRRLVSTERLTLFTVTPEARPSQPNELVHKETSG